MRRKLRTNSENALENKPKKRDANRMRERGNSKGNLQKRLNES